jgi:hypothetical protein
LILIETTVRLPATDCYYVVAYPDKTTPSGDKLWLATGTKKRIGLADLLNFGKLDDSRIKASAWNVKCCKNEVTKHE